jgi:hypothetical protein
LALLASAPSRAEAKKKPPKTSGTVKNEKKTPPPSPNDKGQNEGAQGRRNATEDAARAADSPQFDHRP